MGKPKHSYDGKLRDDDWQQFQQYDFMNGGQMTMNEVILSNMEVRDPSRLQVAKNLDG